MSAPTSSLSLRFLTLSVVLTWAVTAVLTFVIVKVVKIGPVIFVINQSRGWGVHSGDFLFLLPVAASVAITVLWIRKLRTK